MDDLVQQGLFYDPVRRSAPDPHTTRERPLAPTPNTGWEAPLEFPNLAAAKRIAIDTETEDPGLQDGTGPGWARGVGRIVGVSLCVDDAAPWYFPVDHDLGSNINKEKFFRYLADTLSNEKQPKVGANLLYDVGWLEEYNVHVKGLLLDVQYAEALLDDWAQSYSLEALGQTYLGSGKLDEALYNWCSDSYGGPATRNGQAKNIYRAPVELVGPYAEEDARMPLQIIDKQWPELVKQNLHELFLMECRLTPLLIAMRRRGVRVAMDKVEETGALLTEKEQHHLDNIKAITGRELQIYAAADIAVAFDNEGLKYNKTPTGKPSFTQEWLEAHPHDLAKQIVAARKYNKARSTFIENFIIEKEVNGRLHCSFHPLRSDDGGTVSGRYSSSSPNLQQIPSRDKELGPLIRAIYVPDQGHKDWIKIDFCLAGETEIMTSHGNIPIQDIIPGKHKVLSYDLKSGAKPHPKKYLDQKTIGVDYKDVEKCACVGELDVYRITLEDGSTITATAEHRFQKFLGYKKYTEDWIKVSELRPGTRLAHVIETPTGPKGNRIKLSFKGQWLRAELIARSFFGEKPDGHHIDHIDGNCTNDTIDNLRYLPAHVNKAQAGRRYWQDVKKGARSDKLRLTNLKKGLKARRSYKGENNPNYGKGNPGGSGYWFHKKNRKQNHKVVSVEYAGVQPVYQITVADWHTYVTSNGLVHANSQIEYRFLAHFATGPGSDAIRKAYNADPKTDYHQTTMDLIAKQTGKQLSRAHTKNINFGLAYGMGQTTLARHLNLQRREATELFKAYHKGVPFVQQTAKQASRNAQLAGFVQTYLNRRSRFTLWGKSGKRGKPLPYDVAVAKFGPSNIERYGTHKSLNRVIQGSAADLMKAAMLKCWEDGLFDVTGVPSLTVHDELDFSNPGTREAEEALREIVHAMETALELKVPVLADMERGQNWGNVK